MQSRQSQIYREINYKFAKSTKMPQPLLMVRHAWRNAHGIKAKTIRDAAPEKSMHINVNNGLRLANNSSKLCMVLLK